MSTSDRHGSVWEGIDLPTFEPITKDQKTEICIVGAGITGVSIAYEMAKRGHKVTLVEAYRIGSGNTGRTTAHLSYQLEEEFQRLLKMHDKKTIQQFVTAHQTAIDTIEHNIETEGIHCDFKRLDGYLFLGKNEREKFLKKEVEAAELCGVQLEYVERTPLLNEAIPGLRFANQAKFHPLKYLAAMVRVLGDLGVTIYEGTHINHISHPDAKTCILETDQGGNIECANLIIATNTPINDRLFIHTKQFAYRTYAMTFEVPPDHQQQDVLLWDTEDPYHYIRFVDNKLLIGAEDHRTGQDPKGDPFERLEKWSREKFRFAGEVKDKWSGQVFEPADQIAYIGKNPGLETNVYIASGHSGIGMTTGVIASLIIPDLIEKGTHPWASIFDPARKPTHHLSEYVLENINVALQYTDWVRPGEVSKIIEIPEDSGSVVRQGLTKACVYHVSGDQFDCNSAVCSHLGGIVHWNDVEKTWDCPAHGSRFNTKGKVVEGPAISDLPEK